MLFDRDGFAGKVFYFGFKPGHAAGQVNPLANDGTENCHLQDSPKFTGELGEEDHGEKSPAAHDPKMIPVASVPKPMYRPLGVELGIVNSNVGADSPHSDVLCGPSHSRPLVEHQK
jgi:hypothetical protein